MKQYVREPPYIIGRKIEKSGQICIEFAGTDYTEPDVKISDIEFAMLEPFKGQQLSML